eukprot:SAG11_NODE_2275_length_3585_cov_9.453528_2_plen_121_part_00
MRLCVSVFLCFSACFIKVDSSTIGLCAFVLLCFYLSSFFCGSDAFLHFRRGSVFCVSFCVSAWFCLCASVVFVPLRCCVYGFVASSTHSVCVSAFLCVKMFVCFNTLIKHDFVKLMKQIS